MLAGEVSPPRSSRLQAAKGTAARATNRATDPQGAAMPSADDRRQAVALFRYSLIREAADPALGAHERGALVRELAAQRGGLRAFGRFEAEAPNQLWTADALHGPVVAGRKAYLFAAIDDHSRALVGYRWALAEDTLRLEAALRGGFAARGLPGALYVDNGSPFASRQLERCLAVLGIRLVHSKPGQPQGRGKIERAFRTVREQFLVELDTPDGAVPGRRATPPAHP